MPDRQLTEDHMMSTTQPIPIDRYIQRVNLTEDLMSFHPEFLEAVTDQQRRLLRRHYFAGRDVDVASVADFRSVEVTRNLPEVMAADRAWMEYARVAGLPFEAESSPSEAGS
jgi:hypothetical protein